MNLSERREVIAEALEAELAETDLTVYPRWPSSIRLPALIIWPQSQSQAETFDGSRTLTGDLLLLVAWAEEDNERAQEALDEFLSGDGPDLITAAMDLYPALRVTVGGWTDYGLQEMGDEARFWGVRFPWEAL